MSNDDWSDFRADQPTDSQNERLMKLVNQLQSLEEELAETKNRADDLSSEIKTLVEKTIPGVVNGLKGTFKLPDGRRIKIDQKVRCSIKGEDKQATYKWMKEHGYDKILKQQVVVNLDREADEFGPAILELLQRTNFPISVTEKADVHHSTLEAFVREKLSNGEQLPEDVFGIYHQHTVKVL